MAGSRVEAVRKFAYTVKLSPHEDRTAPIKGIITERTAAGDAGERQGMART